MAKTYWCIASSNNGFSQKQLPPEDRHSIDFGSADPVTKFGYVCATTVKLNALPFADLRYSIATQASYLLEPIHIEEVSIIVLTAVMCGNKKSLCSIVRPLLALPSAAAITIFSVLLSNAPPLIGPMIEIIVLTLEETDRDPLFERKCSKLLMNLAASNPKHLGAAIRQELTTRKKLPILCMEITCKFLFDLDLYIDSVVSGEYTGADAKDRVHDHGGWLLSALPMDLLECACTLSLEKTASHCSEDALYSSARAVAVILLVSTHSGTHLYLRADAAAGSRSEQSGGMCCRMLRLSIMHDHAANRTTECAVPLPYEARLDV